MSDLRKILSTGAVLGAVGALAVVLSFGTAIGAGHKKEEKMMKDKMMKDKMMPFGDEANVKYSKDLWGAMEKAKLAGASAKADQPYTGMAPHGAILETITTEVSVGGHKGKLIVKRNYGPEGISIKDVSADRAKHLKAVTVMFRREKGYDADNNDWFWVKYKPDGSLHTNPKGMMLAGRVAKGMDKGCIACHSAQKEQDYVFGKQN